ncbi:MAG: LPS export ABC transporter ATP-binding protein [Candidatus Sumerlaeota bacterium]
MLKFEERLVSRIEVKGLVKTYGGRTVVQNVDLSVSTGEIVGLLGPNGAGKTTTFNMIVGIVRPNDGVIFLDNEDITDMAMYKRSRKGVGYLAQEASVFRKLTVEENVMAILETLDLRTRERRRRLEEVLDELGLAHLRKSRAYTLSGGERRRCEIARALVTEPKFMLLDEPFSGVDPKAVEDLQVVIRQMRKKGLGILITDHSVRETLTVTDRAYIIHEGQVMISGTAEKLINDPRAKDLYFGKGFYMRLEGESEESSDEKKPEDEAETVGAGRQNGD